jgi:hypothetical protein
MMNPRGIIYGMRDLRRWSAAYPNGRLAAAGALILLTPRLLVEGAVLLWEHFPLADDLSVQEITRIQVFQSYWLLTFGFAEFVTFPIGLAMLLFAGWRAWRDKQRRRRPAA